MYKSMHDEGWVRPTGLRNTFDGKSLGSHIEPITVADPETGAKTVLDYGSGKAKTYQPYPGDVPESRFKSRRNGAT
jgi:hypothetical protein